MDTLFLGSGTSVFAFLGESKLNLVAGIVLLAAALWSLVAIVTAFVAPPKRRSVRFGLFTALNVVLSVAGLVYSAVVALEKACVIAVASSIPADNAFLVAIVDLITLGADRAVFRYALYSATALAVIAFIVTLARARRPQFIGPVAMAKDDGYVLVDDGEAPEETEITDEPTEPETERAETEEITDNVTTEEFVEEPETADEIKETDETEEKEETEEPEETSTDEEVEETEEAVEEAEEIGTEAEEEEKPETEEPETEETEPVAENDEEDEPAVPISVARKRIADMGSVLGKLDDLFDNSAFSVEESAYIGKSEEKPAPEPEQEKKEEETERKEENSDLDSVENILGRILAATRSTVKPAPSVAKPIEKKAAEKPKKAVKPEPSVEEIFAEAEENVADDEKEVPQTEEAEPEKIVVDEKIREDAAIAKTERKRAGRVRTIGRAAELFDEYLSAQSDEDKKKLAESIDCIVVDKDKK